MGYKANEEQPHAVLFPYPAQGHLPPILHLAKKLAAGGFTVTIVNIDSIHRNLSNQWSCPPGLDIRLEEVPCELKISAGMDAESIKKDWKAAMRAIENTEAPVEDLLHTLQPRPTCFIADYVLTWSIKVAKMIGIEPVIYFPGSAAWSSLHHHLDLLIANEDIFQEKEVEKDKFITYIPGVEPFRHEDLPDYLNKGMPSTGMEWCVTAYDRMKDCRWVLVNSMVELEPDTFKTMRKTLENNFVPVGPLFPVVLHNISTLGVSLRDEDTQCLKWLDKQEENSVLYISFGSISTLTETAFEELAAGLEASKQPFLWVVRMGLVERSKEESFKSFESFLERTRQQGMVIPWAPQVQVLAHKAVGGFLSHCGWNSLLESICFGVPVLGWPCHSEQSMNCKLLEEDWRLGKRLARKQEMDRVEVETAIREFMNGAEAEEIRARVMAFRDIAHRSVKENGSSHTNLQKFMEAMRDLAFKRDII